MAAGATPIARAQADDLIQSFRFQVREDDALGVIDSTAGFNNVTTPEVSLEIAEYREGNRIYTIKQTGVPTVEACTLQRGIAQKERNFADWILRKALGGLQYRTQLSIEVYAQDQDAKTDKSPIREITCKEALPTRVKLIGDLDATSSDINIQEVEAACEEVVLSTPVYVA